MGKLFILSHFSASRCPVNPTTRLTDQSQTVSSITSKVAHPQGPDEEADLTSCGTCRLLALKDKQRSVCPFSPSFCGAERHDLLNGFDVLLHGAEHNQAIFMRCAWLLNEAMNQQWFKSMQTQCQHVDESTDSSAWHLLLGDLVKNQHRPSYYTWLHLVVK